MTKDNAKISDTGDLTENNNVLELVKQEINRALTSAPVLIRKYTEHLAASGGKYIRAASLLACAEKEDGSVHPNAVKLAAAIELIHLATLVHDDVMDNANIRRGVITLQKKYGKRTAVICGDYLLCMALKMASTASDKENYLKLDVPDYMSRVCLGELNQHINNGFLDLSAYKYFKIISGKTAALFEASFYAGAVLGGVDEPAVRKYMRLGHYIGMIFQMTDDCMDFEMTETIARKPVQSDFEQGVVTLPLIYAFNKMAGLKEKAANNHLSRKDINEAVAKTGGLNYTRMVSKKYYEKSLHIINELELSEDKRSGLKMILDKAYRLS